MLVAAQLIGIPGTQAIGLASLALGLGWVVICLNAMRVGLLTRFMGVLGVICGALIVLPILSPLPIVQTFWLGAMAVAARRALAQRRAARVDDRRGRAVAEPGGGARGAPRRDGSAGAAAARAAAAAGARRPRSDAASRRLQEEEAQAALLTNPIPMLRALGYGMSQDERRLGAGAALQRKEQLHADGRSGGSVPPTPAGSPTAGRTAEARAPRAPGRSPTRARSGSPRSR